MDRLIKVWEPAEEALARLDQALAGSALKGAWLARADFEEAAASLWIEGELVPFEDLVLDDASTNARTPTHQLSHARAVLLNRRSLARQGPRAALTLPGILALQERRERLEGPSPEAEALLDQEYREPDRRLAFLFASPAGLSGAASRGDRPACLGGDGALPTPQRDRGAPAGACPALAARQD
jgi:hypothetical protein